MLNPREGSTKFRKENQSENRDLTSKFQWNTGFSLVALATANSLPHEARSEQSRVTN